MSTDPMRLVAGVSLVGALPDSRGNGLAATDSVCFLERPDAQGWRLMIVRDDNAAPGEPTYSVSTSAERSVAGGIRAWWLDGLDLHIVVDDATAKAIDVDLEFTVVMRPGTDEPTVTAVGEGMGRVVGPSRRPAPAPEPSPYRTLTSREAYRTPWMAIREDEIEFSDGSPGRFSVMVKSDFAMVLPFENDGFWLVQEYRHAIKRRVWNFPQGAWPAGRTGAQEDLAATELREETGLRAQRLTSLGRLYTAVGFSEQAYDVYLAEGLTPGPTDREAGEADMISEWRPLDRIADMIGAGEFPDAHSVAALQLFDLHRRRDPR